MKTSFALFPHLATKRLIQFILAGYLLLSPAILAQQSDEQSAPESQTTKIETEKTEAENSAETSADKGATEPGKISISPPKDQELQTKQDLEHYLINENFQPMLAGANDFLTLVRTNTSANERGVVILLPDWHHRATDPKALNFLAKTLPNQGWTTITLQPKNSPKGYPSTHEKQAIQAEENKAALTDYQQALTPIINALMEKAQDYPGIILMISQGKNAAQLQHHLANDTLTKTQRPNAVIYLSAFMPTTTEDIIFAQQVADSGLPTLDLLLSRDHPLVQRSATQRKQLATKAMKVIYRQRQFNNLTPGYYPEQDLLKQMNGWLRAIGW